MEKELQEDELKDLEEEIDSAVDRLFVESRKGSSDSLLKEPSGLAPSPEEGRESEPAFNVGSLSAPIPAREAEKPQPFSFDLPDSFSDQLEGSFALESSAMTASPEPTAQAKPPVFGPDERLEKTPGPKAPSTTTPRPTAQPKPAASIAYDATEELERAFDFEPPAAPALEKPVVQPPPYLKSIDQLEAQLLSLEWEISHEKLEMTLREVNALKELLKGKKDIGSVLGFMGSVLAEMTADEQNIHPSMVKFLLDAKDTVKLLFEREDEREFEVYKTLARDGIEARFRTLREAKKPDKERPVEPGSLRPVEPSFEKVPVEWRRVEEGLNQWNRFLGKAESLLQRIEQRLAEFERRDQIAPIPTSGENLPVMDITVFKVFGKLYGVESQTVTKLYKVPPSFGTEWGERPKILLKDREVALIDLKKAFPGESWEPMGQPAVMSKLLTVQSEGKWKGVLVEEVVKRFSASPSERKENGKPLLGTVRWNYQARPVDVPILDVRKL